MFFREVSGFSRIIKECTTELFLKEVCGKYHYRNEDGRQLKQTAEAVRSCMEREAFWEHCIFAENEAPFAGVIMSLGSGVDDLQEDYEKDGRLTESYMVETLSGEVLMRAYGAYNAWVAENTSYYVERYYFLGSEKAFPMELLPELLKKLSCPVTCNAGYCMTPKKSVAFYALLTREPGVRCKGVCTGCRREDCPNKIKEGHPLPYGYARILGRDYV